MKNSKKAWLIFKRILLFLFIIFLINNFSVSSGYYEAKVNKKTVLTQEKIEQFEKDVKNGEYIDINDYVVDDYVDTSTWISKTSNKLTEVANDFITNKAFKFFKLVGKLFI